MSMVARLKNWQKQRADQRASQKAKVEFERKLQNWQRADAELAEIIKLARTTGWTSDNVSDLTVILKPEEHWLGGLTGVSLIQPRIGSSHSVTNYTGFSYQLTPKTRIRSGQYYTTHTPGEESPAIADQGNVIITSQRVIFQGQKRAHEWEYRKMLGYINNETEPWTSIQVSNRERVSGVMYSWSGATYFRFRLAWGLAIFQDELDQFAESLGIQRVALGPNPSSSAPTASEVSETVGPNSGTTNLPNPNTPSGQTKSDVILSIERIGAEIDERMRNAPTEKEAK